MGVNTPISKDEARLVLATDGAKTALAGETNVFHEPTVSADSEDAILPVGDEPDSAELSGRYTDASTSVESGRDEVFAASRR
jgi:hypothetical protein